MKQNIILKLAVSVFAFFVLNSGQAQHSGNSYNVDQRSLVSKFFITNFDKTAFPNSRRSEFNTRAVADFIKRYLLAEDVHWYSLSPKNVVAYFNEKGIRTRAFYNNGRWLYSMRTYTEDYLPIEVSNQVKQMFRGFLIASIDEIKTLDQVRYLVHLYDDNYWKNVWFCDGETEVAEELKILR